MRCWILVAAVAWGLLCGAVGCDTTSKLTVVDGLESGTQSVLSAVVTAVFQCIATNIESSDNQTVSTYLTGGS